MSRAVDCAFRPLSWMILLGGAASCAPGLMAEPSPIELELRAGKHARRDVPVIFSLPAELAAAERLSLVELAGDAEKPVAVQRLDGAEAAAAWIVRGELGSGETRRYRLRAAAASERDVEVERVIASDDGRGITYSRGGRAIARYNHGLVHPPEGDGGATGSEFARSGYLHPLWSPAGLVMTNDFPPNHRHHHGIWFPWTATTFEGRKVDFWNMGEKQGRVESAGVDRFGGGPVLGRFRVRHRFVDLTAPDGPKPALDEVWEVRVWALDGVHLIDLESTQTCAGSSPLILHEYRYGGLGLRGSNDWEGPGDACKFRTSEGRTRDDGHGTRARWCDVSGRVGGRDAGITVLSHPANFRFPQHMRIHPSEPFFNFAPCQAGEFRIEPGRPYVSRYRFVIHDGGLEPSACERFWLDYAEPPEVVRITGN